MGSYKQVEVGDVFYLDNSNKVLYLGNFQGCIFVYSYAHNIVEKHPESYFANVKYYVIGCVNQEDLMQSMEHLLSLIRLGSAFNLTYERCDK